MLELIEEDMGYNQTLVEILYANVSDLLIMQYVSLNNALVSSGFTAQLEALDLLEPLISAQEIDALSIPMEVDGIFREAARIALLTCGVSFDEEIGLDTLGELCETILNFDPTESPQTLIDKLSAADDDIDALCITLEYLTDRPYDEWVAVISNVGVGLIQRINQLAQNANDETLATSGYDLKVSYDFAAKLDQIREINKNENIRLEDMQAEPSLESLYLLHLPSLLDADKDVVVDSIMAISCVSSKTFPEVLIASASLLDDMYDDPIERMEVERIKTAFIPKYSKVFE